MSRGKYIIQGRTVVPVDDLQEWAMWMETNSRRIASTEVGDATVSTVFLGDDHNLGFEGPPQLFETLIFGGALDQEMDRCATLAEARDMHEKAVSRCRKAEIELADLLRAKERLEQEIEKVKGQL